MNGVIANVGAVVDSATRDLRQQRIMLVHLQRVGGRRGAKVKVFDHDSHAMCADRADECLCGLDAGVDIYPRATQYASVAQLLDDSTHFFDDINAALVWDASGKLLSHDSRDMCMSRSVHVSAPRVLYVLNQGDHNNGVPLHMCACARCQAYTYDPNAAHRVCKLKAAPPLRDSSVFRSAWTQFVSAGTVDELCERMLKTFAGFERSARDDIVRSCSFDVFDDGTRRGLLARNGDWCELEQDDVYNVCAEWVLRLNVPWVWCVYLGDAKTADADMARAPVCHVHDPYFVHTSLTRQYVTLETLARGVHYSRRMLVTATTAFAGTLARDMAALMRRSSESFVKDVGHTIKVPPPYTACPADTYAYVFVYMLWRSTILRHLRASIASAMEAALIAMEDTPLKPPKRLSRKARRRARQRAARAAHAHDENVPDVNVAAHAFALTPRAWMRVQELFT